MNLIRHLDKLNDSQVRSLNDTMLNAGIAFENGGNYREIFHRAKHQHIGLMRRIYKILEQSTPEDIETLSKSLAGEDGCSIKL
jgi:hypothetical protein